MTEAERLRRWRLVLGADQTSDLGGALSPQDMTMDKALSQLYDTERQAGLGKSSPKVARWLGDIRQFFPTSAVQVMQKDAVERLNLRRLLLEPEMLAAVEPSVDLVATLLTLSSLLPKEAKATARTVVASVVEQVEKRLKQKMTNAVKGSLSRTHRTRRPRGDLDFDRTIRKNLKNWQPDRNTLIAETLVGFGRRRSSLRDIVLCVDQSGSMATSVVYAGIFGAVLASLRAVRTSMVVFDTAVVDLTEELADPIDLLFGTQLGGGTDIDLALQYCAGIISRPDKTIFVLITDLYEGGNVERMHARAQALVHSGVNVLCLLALSDRGAPMSHAGNAARFAAMGIPTFACTPDLFPDLIAAAINKRDISHWAAQNELVLARAE